MITFVCNNPVSDIVNFSFASLFVMIYSTKLGSSCCCFLKMVKFATKAPEMKHKNCFVRLLDIDDVSKGKK